MSALNLPETLLFSHADACLAQCMGQLATQNGVHVEVNASALVEFDSSALAVLLGLRRAILSLGRDYRVIGMSARLRELASLYGVLDLLERT